MADSFGVARMPKHGPAADPVAMISPLIAVPLAGPSPGWAAAAQAQRAEGERASTLVASLRTWHLVIDDMPQQSPTAPGNVVRCSVVQCGESAPPTLTHACPCAWLVCQAATAAEMHAEPVSLSSKHPSTQPPSIRPSLHPRMKPNQTGAAARHGRLIPAPPATPRRTKPK